MNFAIHPSSLTSSSFELAVQRLKQEKPALFQHSDNTDTTNQDPKSIVDNESTYRMIDRACVLYAIYNTTHAYRQIYCSTETKMSTPAGGFIYRGSTWLLRNTLPSSLHRLEQYTSFTAAIVTIAIESIIYKTIAKNTVYCWNTNLFDVAENAIKRTKQLATALLF